MHVKNTTLISTPGELGRVFLIAAALCCLSSPFNAIQAQQHPAFIEAQRQLAELNRQYDSKDADYLEYNQKAWKLIKVIQRYEQVKENDENFENLDEGLLPGRSQRKHRDVVIAAHTGNNNRRRSFKQRKKGMSFQDIAKKVSFNRSYRN